MSETDAAGGGDELRLSVPNRPGSLTAIRDLVRDAARLAGFGRKAAYPARVAGRLAAALMDPRLDPPEQGSIDVLVRPSGGALLVTVHDDGPQAHRLQQRDVAGERGERRRLVTAGERVAAVLDDDDSPGKTTQVRQGLDEHVGTLCAIDTRCHGIHG